MMIKMIVINNLMFQRSLEGPILKHTYLIIIKKIKKGQRLNRI